MMYQYNKFCHLSQLNEEINNSSIITQLDYVQTDGSFTNVYFLAPLDESEELLLNSLIENHIPVYPEIIQPTQPVEILNTEIDDQGRQITRVAAGQKGWTYLAHPIEFETAKFNSLYEKLSNGNDRGASSLKFYDINNNEVTDSINENLIVKTVILIKPDYDYELIAGSLQQIESPSSNVRIWVLGGIPELGSAYMKEFSGGLNMMYYSSNESVKTDGRAAKYMRKVIPGLPYQGNQIQVIVTHDAGYNHKLMLTLEYFRA